jgi:two-component system cell cycle response regulator
LKTKFTDGLSSFGSALSAARKAHKKRPEESAATMRRLARVLLGVQDVSTSLDLEKICRMVSEAKDDDVPELTGILIDVVAKRCAALAAERAVVLIVDDDPVIGHLLNIRLRSPSREIVIATTAAEALDILQHRMISLVTLDLGLPDRDGRDVLSEIRLSGAEPPPPVIVLSALEEPHVKTECFALGADEYFAKPVDIDLLATVVSSKLQRISEIGRKLRHDPLTGVLNRLSFSEVFVRNSAFMARAGGDMSVALIDLDHFKSVNDTHGHAMGDEVLRRTAALMDASLRKSDACGRWGGEEFVLLFPGTTCAGAAKSLEGIADDLHKISFTSAAGKTFHVTFSAGVSPVGSGENMEAAVAAADALLYRAKHLGRNRICRADQENVA